MIPVEEFRQFTEAVFARLEIGAEQYADQSFSRPPAELIDELQQELEDVCAWSFILHCRLQEIKKRAARIQ